MATLSGRLRICGTETSPVTLDSKDDHEWHGIFLSGEGADNAEIGFCNISEASGSPVDPAGNSYVSAAEESSTAESENAEQFVPPPLRYGGQAIKQYGGAICANQTSGLAIKNCLFSRCKSELGGAVHVYRCSDVVFEKCIFQGNMVMPLAGKSIAAAGGAVSIINSSSIDFRYCRFEANKALAEWSCGGAVSVNFRGSASFTKCEFIGNVASHTGGAFYCLSMRPQFKKRKVSESDQVSREIAFTECSFHDNRALRKFHNPRKSGWENYGHEIAVDAGCTVSLGQCDITSSLMEGRLIHLDSGADQKGDGSILAPNRAAMTLRECVFQVKNADVAIIAPWEANEDRVSLWKESVSINQNSSSETLPGLASMSDDLMPLQKTVSGKLRKYFRARDEEVVVDTVVIHHVSAINWDRPDAVDSEVKAEAESKFTADSDQSKRFSPDLCKAIFEAYGVSTHYLITREGYIRRLVPHSEVAFHAGESIMPNPPDVKPRKDVNRFSIGIELIAVHPQDYDKVSSPKDFGYTDEQYSSLNELLAYLHGQFWAKSGESTIKFIVGHDEIAGETAVNAGHRKGPPKKDPGPDFDWKRVRKDDFSPLTN